MPKTPFLVKLAATLAAVWLAALAARADDFTNFLDRANAALLAGKSQQGLDLYARAQTAATNNAPELCLLCRRYCDLMHQTRFIAAQRVLLTRALNCGLAAVQAGPANPLAHASLAVCYAKECQFADIKASLADSRLFKAEAETALRLDPRQDTAWYLLGRWNYALANVGFWSRAYVRLVYGGLPAASNADAIKDFQAAIAIAPGHILYHETLADAYKTIGNKPAALAQWHQCVALKPLDPDDEQARLDALKALGMK